MTKRRKDRRHSPHRPRALVPPRAVDALERIAAALEAANAPGGPAFHATQQAIIAELKNGWAIGRQIREAVTAPNTDEALRHLVAAGHVRTHRDHWSTINPTPELWYFLPGQVDVDEDLLAEGEPVEAAPSTAHLRQGVPLPADNIVHPDAWPLGRAVAGCTVCGGLGTVQGALDSRRFPCPVCAASRASITSAPTKRLQRDPATLLLPFWCSAEIFIHDCDRCIGEDRECPKCGGKGIYTSGTDELGRFVYGPGVLGGPLPRHRPDVDKALTAWVAKCREHRSRLTVDAFLVEGEADPDAETPFLGGVVLGQCGACPDGPGNEACEFCMGSGMALWGASDAP